MRKAKGFTLLEFVVVMVLMGLIGAAIVPNMKLVDVRRVKAVGNELVYDLKAQRTRAMNGKVDTYGIELIANADGEYYGYTMPPAVISGGSLATINKREDITKKTSIELKAYTKTLGVKKPVSVYFDRYGHMYLTPTSAVGVPDIESVTKLEIQITYNNESVVYEFDGLTGNGRIKE